MVRTRWKKAKSSVQNCCHHLLCQFSCQFQRIKLEYNEQFDKKKKISPALYPNCDFERTFLQKTKLLESSGGLLKRSSHRVLKFSSCYIAFPFVKLPQHFFIILFLFIQMQNSYLILDEYVSIKRVLRSSAGRSRSSVVFLVRTLSFGYFPYPGV